MYILIVHIYITDTVEVGINEKLRTSAAGKKYKTNVIYIYFSPKLLVYISRRSIVKPLNISIPHVHTINTGCSRDDCLFVTKYIAISKITLLYIYSSSDFTHPLTVYGEIFKPPQGVHSRHHTYHTYLTASIHQQEALTACHSRIGE